MTRTHCGGNIVSCDVARVLGKTRQHCCTPRGHKKCFWRFSEIYYVSATNVARVTKRTNLGNMITSTILPPKLSSFCLPLSLGLLNFLVFMTKLLSDGRHDDVWWRTRATVHQGILALMDHGDGGSGPEKSWDSAHQKCATFREMTIR